MYDGEDINAPLLATYTGTNIPPAVTSSGHSLLVRFTSDGAGEAAQGFEAAFQAVCEPGTTWDAVSAACKPCPHGSFSSAPNAPACTPCPAGQYAPNEGSTSCTACPQFATTPSQGSYLAEACICQPGYYALDSVCEVCAEGAECLGGNLMKARAGWCEVPPTDEAGSVASFLHCCRPEECTGGVGATCDASIATVGVEDCAVRYLSWDTIHLVSLSDATWVTIGVILALLLTIFFCCGLALGWKRALKRFEKQIAPQLAAGGSYGRLGVTHTPVESLTPQLMPPPESNATESEYRGTPPPQRQDERGADSQYVWTPEANRKGATPPGGRGGGNRYSGMAGLLAGSSKAFEPGETNRLDEESGAAADEGVVVVDFDDVGGAPPAAPTNPPYMRGSVYPIEGSSPLRPSGLGDDDGRDDELLARAKALAGIGDTGNTPVRPSMEQDEATGSPMGARATPPPIPPLAVAAPPPAETPPPDEDDGSTKKSKKEKKGKKGKEADDAAEGGEGEADEGGGEEDGGKKKGKKKGKKGKGDAGATDEDEGGAGEDEGGKKKKKGKKKKGESE